MIDVLYQNCFSYFKYILLFCFFISVCRSLFKFVVRPCVLSLDNHDDNNNDVSKNDVSKNDVFKNDVYTKYYAHYDDLCD